MSASLRFHQANKLGVAGYLGHWSLELDPFTYPDGGDHQIAALMIGVPVPHRAGYLTGVMLGQQQEPPTDWFPYSYTTRTPDWEAGISLDSTSLPSWVLASVFYLPASVWGAARITPGHVYLHTGAGLSAVTGGLSALDAIQELHTLDLEFSATTDPASTANWYRQYPET